jgi:hypothetical protein
VLFPHINAGAVVFEASRKSKRKLVVGVAPRYTQHSTVKSPVPKATELPEGQVK